jgi:hypothetical protein
MDWNKIFRRISWGVWISLAIFLLFDKTVLGLGICFTLAGLLSLTAFYFNTEPLGISISGFDYAMQKLLKEYYNRFFNLSWGLVELLIGIAALYKFLG